MSLEEIAARFFWTEDILITEGFKRARFPKIEVFRSAVEPKPICGPADNLIALVSDDHRMRRSPCFHLPIAARSPTLSKTGIS